jgi:hypothetical protein
MRCRDRQTPSLAEEGQRRRSQLDSRLADQLRQNLLRRKIQTRARDTLASEGQGQAAQSQPKPERGTDLE